MVTIVTRITFAAIVIFLLGTATAITLSSWAIFGIAFALSILTEATILLFFDRWMP
jgi:hypothetical protein